MDDKNVGDLDRPAPFTLPEGPVERSCRVICYGALIIMLAVIAVDIVTRSLFHYSLEISDEIAGYMLVVLAFLSLPVCQVHAGFHEVELLQARLTWRAQMISKALFELISFGAVLLLLWKYWELVARSWRFDERAPTYLETALWLPRSALVIGLAALAVSLMRTIFERIRQVRASTRQGSP